MLTEDTWPPRPAELDIKACGECNANDKYASGHQGHTGWGTPVACPVHHTVPYSGHGVSTLWKLGRHHQKLGRHVAPARPTGSLLEGRQSLRGQQLGECGSQSCSVWKGSEQNTEHGADCKYTSSSWFWGLASPRPRSWRTGSWICGGSLLPGSQDTISLRPHGCMELSGAPFSRPNHLSLCYCHTEVFWGTQTPCVQPCFPWSFVAVGLCTGCTQSGPLTCHPPGCAGKSHNFKDRTAGKLSYGNM